VKISSKCRISGDRDRLRARCMEETRLAGFLPKYSDYPDHLRTIEQEMAALGESEVAEMLRYPGRFGRWFCTRVWGFHLCDIPCDGTCPPEGEW
jgi:hypothetical protein